VKNNLQKGLENPAALCYTECAVSESGCPEGAPMNRQPSNTTITALYERLSRDDELQGPSNSIKNQQTILEDYARKNGFSNIVHYTDDGISGTRFDRPGFVKLMDDIEAGKVGIVLCKDTSRLGRDYLRVGMFMETLRQKDVRLIALGDNVDTSLGEDDFLPFRNILHEFYARDTSRKIKAIYKSKGMSGKYTSSHALYGYVKSGEDKSRWEIDPVAAEVVRRIFRMTLEGYGPYQIASVLQAEKVPSPSYYLAQKEMGNRKNSDFQDPCRWWGTTVMDILGRQEYIGRMVNFKTYKNSFKDKNRKPNPAEQQVVFEGKHEPIIDPETWETANRIRQNSKRRRLDSLGEPQPLTGLLRCADCGGKLYHERCMGRHGKPKNNYVCSSYRKHTADCTMHNIHADVVKELVLDTLRAVCTYARENEAEFTRQVNEMFSEQQAGTAKAQRKKLTASQKRHAELDRLIQRIYEDNVAGRITDKRFEVLSAEYEQEQAGLEQTIAELQTGIDSFDDSAARAKNFLMLARRYKDISELTAPMLHEFVHKIIVHERAERWVRYTKQKVEIFLNFIEEYAPPEIAQPEPDPAAIAELEQQEKRRLYHRDYQRKRKANGGKRLTPPDTRTPEQKAADDEARYEKKMAYQREYQREYQRRKAREKREAQAAESKTTA